MTKQANKSENANHFRRNSSFGKTAHNNTVLIDSSENHKWKLSVPPISQQSLSHHGNHAGIGKVRKKHSSQFNPLSKMCYAFRRTDIITVINL